jgi:6,7-dimethyl-8-ribityllumazine synthase
VSYAIVVARFYEHLADRLIGGAQTAFAEAGAGEADVFDVPGAFELPLAARYAARSSAARPTTTTGSVARQRVGSRTSSSPPACRAPSAC